MFSENTIESSYEKICDECQGFGNYIKPDPKTGEYYSGECHKCKGSGIITWIDKIMRGDKNGIK